MTISVRIRFLGLPRRKQELYDTFLLSSEHATYFLVTTLY